MASVQQPSEVLGRLSPTDYQAEKFKIIRRRMAFISAFAAASYPVACVLFVLSVQLGLHAKSAILTWASGVAAYIGPSFGRTIDWLVASGRLDAAMFLAVVMSTSIMMGMLCLYQSVKIVRQIDLDYYVVHAREVGRRPNFGIAHNIIAVFIAVIMASLIPFLFLFLFDYEKSFTPGLRRYKLVVLFLFAIYPLAAMLITMVAMQVKKVFLILNGDKPRLVQDPEAF